MLIDRVDIVCAVAYELLVVTSYRYYSQHPSTGEWNLHTYMPSNNLMRIYKNDQKYHWGWYRYDN